MVTSGLNDIFHLCAYSDIFYRSPFNTSVEVLLLYTTESGEVSSAKSFTLDSMLSEKSFMYFRKRSGPRIDSCGTLDQEWALLNLKPTLVSAYKVTFHAKLCQKPWKYPEKYILHQE